MIKPKNAVGTPVQGRSWGNPVPITSKFVLITVCKFSERQIRPLHWKLEVMNRHHSFQVQEGPDKARSSRDAPLLFSFPRKPASKTCFAISVAGTVDPNEPFLIVSGIPLPLSGISLTRSGIPHDKHAGLFLVFPWFRRCGRIFQKRHGDKSRRIFWSCGNPQAFVRSETPLISASLDKNFLWCMPVC